jgi:mono/diheme cytochrome c family protein
MGALILLGTWVHTTKAADDKPWVAPDDALKVKNPVKPTPANLSDAAELFRDNCETCHGTNGAGDGPSAKTLPKKPANFTDAKMMKAATDGELFWKMSNGRGPMPSWQNILSDTERWELVNYLRTLTEKANGAK